MIITAIFGGSGFIGRNLVEELIKTDREVLVFDIFPFPDSALPVKSYDTRLLSDDNLLELLEQVDEIVDLVYTSNPKTSFDDPVLDILENLPVTVRILSLASKIQNLKKFVFVSSGGAVYGNTNKNNILEKHAKNPVSPYGITKLAVEKYGLMFLHTNNLPFIIARPANAYGIGQRVNTGQGFIAQAINSILKGKELEIFGKNGTVRDYIYVTDIATGIIAILDFGIIGEAYNIGTGIGKSNLDIVEELKIYANQNNIEVLLRFNEERKFDVKRNILNYSKINEISGWKNKIDIESGLKMTWDCNFKLQQNETIFI